MRAVSKSSQAVLEKLAHGLNSPGDSRRIGGEIGASSIMPVSVERLDANTVSVAHYYKQHGDLMRDPEVVYWWAADGKVYPIEWTQDGVAGPYGYNRLVEFEAGQPVRYVKRQQAEVASFTGTWMTNIKDQQRAWFRGEEPSVDRIEGADEHIEDAEPAPHGRVTAALPEAAMAKVWTDEEIWGPEAEALTGMVLKVVVSIDAKYAKYQDTLRPGIQKKLISILASGAKPKRGYVVGPQGPTVEEEIEAIVSPRVPTPRVPTPPQSTPQGAQKYTREQAEAAILTAWDQFRVARAELFVV